MLPLFYALIPLDMLLQSFKKFLTTAALACICCTAYASEGEGWLNSIDGGSAQPSGKPDVSVRLISKNDSLTPQAVNEMAVVIDQKNGWHTYWRMPGDAGLKTKFYFNVPKNYDVEVPKFPLSERIATGGLVSFGYSGETVFPFNLDVPRFVRFGDKVTISVRVEYLACRDICVPGEATASIRLPLKVAAKEGKDALKIEQAKRLIPEVVEKTGITAVYEQDRIKVSVPPKTGIINRSMDFHPLDEGMLRLAEAPLYRLNEQGDRELYLFASDAFKTAPPSSLRGVLIADGGPAEGGWAVETTIPLAPGLVPDVKAQLEPKASTRTFENDAAGRIPTATMGAIAAAGLALLGGLILNLMPCVFPVLSLKLLHLVKSSGSSRPELARHGLLFASGVLSAMLLLAGLLIILRNSGEMLGWGFQLQNPVVVSLLLFLFVAIALNLAGLFEINIGSGASNKLSQNEGAGSARLNSFLTGALAVVVASPCTAPFMGAALGYALTQSAAESLFIFSALAVGMALPWVLLCIFPGWIKKMPKPGAWMEKFKKAMAVPMALAAAWLAWVLSKQISFSGMLVVLCGASAGGVSLWLLGREQWGRGSNRPLMLFTAFVAAASIFAAALPQFKATPASHEELADSGWSPWSRTAVSRAIASGRPVFVDFTAAWCVTCQANKFTALKKNEVQAKMDELGYVRLVADWTNKDPEISKILAEFGRSGVPLYLIYRTDGSVDVLPELLTADIVLKAL